MTVNNKRSAKGHNSGTGRSEVPVACTCKDMTNRLPYYLNDDPERINPFPKMFDVVIGHGESGPLMVDKALKKELDKKFKEVRNSFDSFEKENETEAFIERYRKDVPGYYRHFMKNVAPRIEKEIGELFSGGYPKYMVTTGIGANELFTRFAASINNKNEKRRVTWFVLNSPKDLLTLPQDANVDNTLFLDFSRSGVAEETIKIHEYTPKKTKRIVFTNGGPLMDLAIKDGNLFLDLPKEVSGRYGRNKTPILLAPMFVAGMDAAKHWKDIQKAIRAFDIEDENSLPFVIAKFIYTSRMVNDINLIYLGCNDDDIGLLGDQFLQFWNEGVNRPGNDMMVSRFFGLPRDSHMSIEGILGNHKTKMGFFLLRTNMRTKKKHPLVSAVPAVNDPDHKGLQFGDEDVIFAMANYKILAEHMPTLLIGVPGEITMEHSAVLGQLFADVTFIYSRMIGVDPGSNPEVEDIRTASTSFLSSAAKEMRENKLSIEKAARKLPEKPID